MNSRVATTFTQSVINHVEQRHSQVLGLYGNKHDAFCTVFRIRYTSTIIIGRCLAFRHRTHYPVDDCRLVLSPMLVSDDYTFHSEPNNA